MNRGILVLVLLSACGPKSKPATPEDEPAAALDREDECDAATTAMFAFTQCPQLGEDELQMENAKMLLFMERIEPGDPVEGEEPVVLATAQECHDAAAEAQARWTERGCDAASEE